MGSVNEFIATLEDLGPTLSQLGLEEKQEQPAEYFYTFGPITEKAIRRLTDLFTPLMEAGTAKFESSEIEQMRRKRAELDKQFAEAG